MNFDGHALTDFVLVDARPERDHRAHIFVAGSEILVERFATLDESRRTVIDDFKIGGADRHRIDPHQHFGTGTGFSVSLSSPGLPSTQAFIRSGIGTSALVFTPGPAYIVVPRVFPKVVYFRKSSLVCLVECIL